MTDPSNVPDENQFNEPYDGFDSHSIRNQDATLSNSDNESMLSQGPRYHRHHHHHHQHSQNHRDNSFLNGEPDHQSTQNYETLNLTIRRHPPHALDPAAHHIVSGRTRHSHSPRHSPVRSPVHEIQVKVRPPAAITRRKPLPPRSPTPPPPPPPPPVQPQFAQVVPMMPQNPNVQVFVTNNPTPRSNRPTITPSPPPTPKAVDPDERPIRPMRSTNVYQPVDPPSPAPSRRALPPKRKILTPKPPPPPVSPIRIEPESNRSVPSRIKTNNVPLRRPVRLDIIPKKPAVIVKPRPRPARVIIEEYEEPLPEIPVIDEPEVIEYRILPSTRRQRYPAARPARIVRVQEPPTVRRIIYRS